MASEATDALIFHLTDLRLKIRDTRLTAQGMLEGTAKLAYEIGGHKRATYYLTYFKAPTTSLAGIRTDANLSEKIIRHLILALEQPGRPELPRLGEPGGLWQAARYRGLKQSAPGQARGPRFQEAKPQPTYTSGQLQ